MGSFKSIARDQDGPSYPFLPSGDLRGVTQKPLHFRHNSRAPVDT